MRSKNFGKTQNDHARRAGVFVSAAVAGSLSALVIIGGIVAHHHRHFRNAKPKSEEIMKTAPAQPDKRGAKWDGTGAATKGKGAKADSTGEAVGEKGATPAKNHPIHIMHGSGAGMAGESQTD